MSTLNRQKRKVVEEAALESTQATEKRKLITSSRNAHDENPIDLIADISEAILEAPESAFSAAALEDLDSEGRARKLPSKMRQLLNFASAKGDSSVSQLALLSLLAVFKDILPSYRIRLPSIKEMAVKVSKDTKKMWDFERALLTHYQDYLKLLESTWQKHKADPSPQAIAAILCLSELLKSAFHFNFRSNLIAAVVRAMNHSIDQVSHSCCSAIEFVFENDAQGEVASETTRQVAKLIKDRGFKIRSNVLQTFRALPLRVHDDEAQAAKIMAQQNAKKRKKDKESAEIAAELRESQATVDKLQLARCQSDMLESVTLTYFRILKSDNLSSSHIKELLPVALDGLAKYAHLINIDTVMDLLEVFKSLLRDVDALPVDAALNCVLAAFQMLHGPGKELQIDPKEYLQPLYKQLRRLCSDEIDRNVMTTILRCLEAAFLRRREFSTTRIAAFVKRICTVAVSSFPHGAAPLLAFNRQLITRYDCTQQLLENEEDVIMSGQYDPCSDDPEQSNVFATAAWELALLKFNYHPSVALQALSASTAKMLQLPEETPEKILAQVISDNDVLYIPFKRTRKRHPLDSREKADGLKQKRARARFVTPRISASKIV
ncbi:hypothetical protein MPSEU_000426800 [Mayamaea pseudoterrestris]|nr:hypothetical protein MPSEU_000426800 [Mayamaea pseudoterrestris]